MANDKLTEVNTIVDESSSPYYTDMYNAGETKEQLQVGFEVAKPKEASGTIDTSDAGLTKIDNVYTLSVPNPDGKIFSIGINGLEKTFKIGFFNNSALAYSTLLTELQTWLGYDYQVAYVSGTNYTISRTDGGTITKSSPNLVRTITLSGFDTISVIDVIVDGVTVTLDGPTHGGSSSTAITYLKSQLSSTIYYMNDNGSVLTIARKDGAIPVITKTQYNKYTYAIAYQKTDTPSSGQYPDYVDTIIDGNTFRYDYQSNRRLYKGDKHIRNLMGYAFMDIINDNSTSTTAKQGIQITPWFSKAPIITKNGGSTATKCYLTDSSGGTTYETVNFVGNTATFTYVMSAGTTYKILCDNNGASYTATYATVGVGYGATNVFDEFTLAGPNPYNISRVYFNLTPAPYNISARYNRSGATDTVWDITQNYYGYTNYLDIYKTDYSAITISSNNHYTDPGTFSDDNSFYSLTTTNHLADITTATLTEISITSTLSSYGLFIPVGFNPKKIQMTATSSVGTSAGSWTADGQSCTTKYGTTTAFVTDKIFKTDASNYGNIITTRRGGFTITYTVNTSNKLDYICT